MKVEVRIFSTLRKFVSSSEKPMKVTLDEEATINDLLNFINIPPQKVKFTFVNFRQEPSTYRLKEGDRVGIFPPSGGG